MQKSTLESYKMPRSWCFDDLLLLKLIVQHDRSISSTPSHHALNNIPHIAPSAALSTPHSLFCAAVPDPKDDVQQ